MLWTPSKLCHDGAMSPDSLRFALLPLALTLLLFTGCATIDQTSDHGNSIAERSKGADPLRDETHTAPQGDCAVLPDGYSFLGDIAPAIATELRYATAQNFTGGIVEGYAGATDVVLRTDAATALTRVQQELEAEGLGLLVYDAFRPTRAVANFVAWSQTPDDHTKAEYYPQLNKTDLFEQGYIAAESNHSRGGTVDLTLIDLESGDPLDMGGTFDLFDERSHGDSAEVTPEQREHRDQLADVMTAAGFAPYAEEWWHYSYPVPEDARREDFALARCDAVADVSGEPATQ